ncbi:MAG: FMN-binding protein, partial [Treponema sp.]|nr:FMN-binding protein [Treponema sp.]
MKKIFALCLLAAMSALLCVSCSSSRYADLAASLPDLGNKPDGTYRGEYDLKGTPVFVALEIVVQNHAIAAIKILKHSSSPIGKKAEKITEEVINRQSL